MINPSLCHLPSPNLNSPSTMRSAVGAAFSYQCAATLTDLHLGNVTAMAFSPTGEYLASASDDKTLFIIDVFRRWPRLLLEMEHPAFVTAVIWSDASLLYLGRSDGIIFVLLVKVDEVRQLNLRSSIDRQRYSRTAFKSWKRFPLPRRRLRFSTWRTMRVTERLCSLPATATASAFIAEVRCNPSNALAAGSLPFN